MNSLQVRMTVAVSITATLVALLAGALSFAAAFEQAQGTQDRRLKAIANLFATYTIPIPRRLRNGPEAEFDAYVAVEPVGDPRWHFFNLAADVPEGYRTVEIGKEAWRVFVHIRSDGRERIAVGQRTVIRNDIAWNAGLWTAVPLLMLVPILCGVIFLLVRRMVNPITAFSANLDRRTDSDLSPLKCNALPTEIVPIASAINGLLERLEGAMEVQRRFIADAAHELRSPLAALSIQVENVSRSLPGQEAAARLEPLRLGIARAHGLMEKLLALARAHTPTVGTPPPIDVGTSLRSVLEELLPAAHVRNLEIEVSCPECLYILVSEFDLTLIFRNLLDNAIRYAGPGGIIEVYQHKSGRFFCLEIKDYGPGIAETERERVCDAFYRILGNEEAGTGLGLSIVKTVVQKLRGSITFDWTLADQRKGLSVRVLLPI